MGPDSQRQDRADRAGRLGQDAEPLCAALANFGVHALAASVLFLRPTVVGSLRRRAESSPTASPRAIHAGNTPRDGPPLPKCEQECLPEDNESILLRDELPMPYLLLCPAALPASCTAPAVPRRPSYPLPSAPSTTAISSFVSPYSSYTSRSISAVRRLNLTPDNPLCASDFAPERCLCNASIELTNLIIRSWEVLSARSERSIRRIGSCFK